jgi:hypothetical protein
MIFTAGATGRESLMILHLTIIRIFLCGEISIPFSSISDRNTYIRQISMRHRKIDPKKYPQGLVIVLGDL